MVLTLKFNIEIAFDPWNPLVKHDFVSLKRVHSRFTKSIHNFTSLTYMYEQRLKALNKLSLEDSACSLYVEHIYRCEKNLRYVTRRTFELHHRCEKCTLVF